MQVSRRRRLRDLTVGLSVLVAAVLAVVAYVWVNIEHMRATGRDDAEAREELAWADAVLDAAGDQDNALQALSSTGDRRYIAPYEVGSARFDGALAHLTA